MMKTSHRLFALGISSTVAFFLSLNIMSLPILLAMGYFIGSLPDADLKLGIKHRGFTHTIVFFTVMTFVCSFAVFYFYYFIQQVAGFDIFGVGVTYFNGFPIPSFFAKLASLDASAIFGDAFLKFIVFFFVSFTSHFILDLITPAGLDVGKSHVSGSIKSNNSAFNFFFSLVGGSMFVVSVALVICRDFVGISLNWATWYFLITGSLVLIVIIASVAYGSKKGDKDLKCFKIGDRIDVCVPRGKCFQTGLDEDERVCNLPDDDSI